ncbi:MAG: hypothetical protein ACM31C_20735 [Acidobacteriota bacterium]
MRAAGYLLVLAACQDMDVTEPIELVAPSWTADARAQLAAAAACWTLRFGIALEVVDEPSTSQVVVFDFDALACWGAWGRYLPGEPAHDSICPVRDMQQLNAAKQFHYADDVLLFTVAEHELGHALNIPNVSASDRNTEALAVMGINSIPTEAVQVGGAFPAFSAFDVAQLAAANPGFVPQPACGSADVVVVPDTTTRVACACR